MTDFLTHVELHEASTQDYQALDLAMEAANFSKTMNSTYGFTYRMPSATYFSQAANMSTADVRNLAMVAAHRTGRRYDVVTTSGDIAYFLHPAG